jgi:putative selenate reductase
VVAGAEAFRVEQVRQIIHVDDFCNECGNCATFCVHRGEPYRDKPRLFLVEGHFRSEDDNAFYIEKHEKGWAIKRRKDGQECWLSAADDTGEIAFENDWLRVTLSSPDFQVQEMELKQAFQGEFSLVDAAEMRTILKGVTISLPFLPFGRA